MMQRSAPPTFPEALDDDDDDVTWALQTAAVQWKRGAHSDAVEWLRRAAESAVDSGRAIRARELTQQTNAIEAALRTGWVPRLTPSGHPAESARGHSGRAPSSSRAPLGGRALHSSHAPASARAPNSSRPPASARPFPLRTSKPPAANPFVGPPSPANPFTSSPLVNPFSGGRANASPGTNARRGAASDDDGAEPLEPEAYGELAVDIDVDAESVPPRARRDFAHDAAELSDDELVEEVEDFDEVDLAALSAARRPAARAPFVSAPELETGPALEADFDLEASEYSETDGDEDDERPTLPPSSSNRDPKVLVPSSLRDEIDELLGKPVRRSSRAAPAPGTPEPAKRTTLASRVTKVTRPPAPQVQEEEEPTERSLEPAPDLATPDAPFSDHPAEETTERDFEAERALDIVPSSRRREKLPESEPGTSPDLQVPFANSDSTPPTEPSPELPGASASQREPEAKQPESVEPAAESKAAPELEAVPSEPPPVLSEPPLALSEAAPARSEPAPALPESVAAILSEPPSGPRPSNPPRPAEIGGVLLSGVQGLEDLPDESQAQLVDSAEIHTLAANEEVAGFGLALVLDGFVAVMPEVADVAAAQARRGELVFSQGHLDDGIRMRVVAGANGAQVAVWPYEAFSAAITACPWVGDELKNVGDRFQALAGVAMGPMGDQLDDMLRSLVIERCQVKRLLPWEVISEVGKIVPGMVIVGAGRLEIVEGAGDVARVLEELHPGDFLFAPQILQASPAPATARAGKGGALVLFAERKIAHELLVGVPPLLGIFAC